jgi:hypothetical protein
MLAIGWSHVTDAEAPTRCGGSVCVGEVTWIPQVIDGKALMSLEAWAVSGKDRVHLVAGCDASPSTVVRPVAASARMSSLRIAVGVWARFSVPMMR